MKKIKTLLCVMLVLATAACLCVSVAAVDKNTPPTEAEWHTCKGGQPHTPVLKSTATCAQAGHFYWQCSVCGIRYDTKDGDPQKEHELGEPIKDGTKITYKCKNCSYTYTIETNGLCEHTWTEPTPVVAGVPCDKAVKCTHKCTKCGAVEYVDVVFGHKWYVPTYDCTKKICSVCGAEEPTGKEHVVTTWKKYNDSTHVGTCDNCTQIFYEAHETKTAYEGDCTKDVVCKCGAVVLAGQPGHNKYPSFGGDNNPGWYYVVTSDGKHSRQCSNPGCEQPTYVDVHEAGKGGASCTLCMAMGVSAETTGSDTTTTAPADTTTPATTDAVTSDAVTSTATETVAPSTTDAPTTDTVTSAPADTTTPATTDAVTSDAVTSAATETVETPTTETAAPATTEAPTPDTTEAVTNQEPHLGTVAPEPAKEGEVIVELGEETDAKINVDNITKTNLTVKNIVEEKFTEYAAYDINLVKDGAKVQPDGTVKVSIALPDGWSDVDVYHVDRDVMTKLETTVKDGYAVFNTTHFSVYVLVNNKSAATPTDTDTTAEPETTGETASAPADDIVPAPEASAETTGAFDGYEPDENTLLISPAPKTGELPDMTIAVTVTLVTSLLAASAIIIAGKKKH